MSVKSGSRVDAVIEGILLGNNNAVSRRRHTRSKRKSFCILSAQTQWSEGSCIAQVPLSGVLHGFQVVEGGTFAQLLPD